MGFNFTALVSSSSAYILPSTSEGSAEGGGAVCMYSGLWHTGFGGGNGIEFSSCVEI